MTAARPFVPASARFVVALFAVISVTACDLTTGPGQDPPDEMLFLSTRVSASPDRPWSQTDNGIFRTDAQGNPAVHLTGAAGAYRSVSVSADGGTVAYMTQCNTAWVMNPDGSNAREVAGYAPYRCIYRPRISPDGSRLAMTSTRLIQGLPGGYRIWVLDISSGNAVEVSNSVGTSSWMYGWSPDGRVIFHHGSAPTVDTPSTFTTYIVNADGTNLQPLFSRPGDHSPWWSPDGSRIAFISDREGSADVYVMNADGTGVRRLTDVPGEAWFEFPTDIWGSAVSPWSPDGTRIAFTTQVDGLPGNMYSVRADGTGLSTLADASTRPQYFGGWSPSGRRIAFSTGGMMNLYIADADGSNLQNLTDGGWQDSYALWLPRR